MMPPIQFSGPFTVISPEPVRTPSARFKTARLEKILVPLRSSVETTATVCVPLDAPAIKLSSVAFPFTVTV